MDAQPLQIPLDGKNAEFECSASSTTICSLSESSFFYMTRAPNKNHPTSVQAVTKSFPSPLIYHVEEANKDPQVSHVERLKAPESQSSSCNKLVALNPLQNVHVSARLMEDFLQLASDNTEKDLETCGILGAILDKETFYVTTLIIPKQESTSNSCQAKYEEEVFAIQHEHSLFPVGWIHVMVPEAIAIVMAPTDKSRSYGIFQLTDEGMHILRDCQEKSFHPHKEPMEGHSIYQHCSNVYTNSHLRFEIFDLR